MKEIISAILVVGGLGLVFGCLLAFAYKVFYVQEDERIDKINEVLPGANCGACGYAGCSAYASAIVKDGAPTNACIVGKVNVAQSIANIMGVAAGDTKSLTARVLCAGDCDAAYKKYTYMGVPECESLAKLSFGDKDCPHGCLGLGSCISVCKFDAISIENDVAVIDKDKCTGCGACVKKCPKQVIALVPKDKEIYVKCSSTEKGAVSMKQCTVSCIGCKKCEKTCPSGAITVENNLAVINYDKCTSCGACLEACPKHAIVR